MKSKLSYLSILASGLLVLAACGGSDPASSSVEESSTPGSSDTGTSIPASSDTGTSDTGTSIEPPAPTGHTDVDVFYIDEGNLAFHGESEIGAGEIAYWAGDGGAVTSAFYTESTDTISVAYTNSGQWYGVQIFYRAPYLELGTVTYNIKASITSSVSGSMTLNAQAIELTAGTAYEVDIENTPAANTSVLSMQLGVNGSGVLPSGTLSIAGLSIIDTTSTYYQVDFVDSDESAIDSVMCMAEHTLWEVPADPTAPEGSIFDGWVDEAGTKVDLATYVPTDDVTLKASYAEANIDVNFYIGENVVHSVKTYDGGKVAAPSLGYDECGFGYGVAGWYKESSLTTAWDFDNDTVSEATNLYAKLQITYSDLYQLEGQWDLSTFSHDDDGALIYSGDQGGWAASWNKQINFRPVPVGTTGTTYNLTFEYKANAAFVAQVYEDTQRISYANMALTVSTDAWVTGTLSFPGGIGSNTKLTFEMGAQNTGSTNEFSLRNIAITAVA